MTGRYAVAYFSIFKGELKLEIVNANTELEAAMIVLSQNGWDFGEDEDEEDRFEFDSLDDLIAHIEEMGDDWLEVKAI